MWFMRQAGRSLPEYRAVRDGISMLDSCSRPDLVAEITLQPVRRYGVDAAILYSDIMVPLQGGRGRPGHRLRPGPGASPSRSGEPADLEQMRPLDAGRRSGTSPRRSGCWSPSWAATPLIGFAGAPFTLASYLVEGGPSKDYARTKALMVGEPELWDELCSRLAAAVRDLPAGSGRRRGRARCSCSTPGSAA